MNIGVIGIETGASLFPINRDHCTTARITAVCSARPSRDAAPIIIKWDIQSYTRDAHVLFRDDTIDVIAIFSPIRFRYQHCLAALDAGKHVMCAEPLAESPQEEAALAALAGKRDLVLQTVDPNRCTARDMLRFMERIEITEPVSVQ